MGDDPIVITDDSVRILGSDGTCPIVITDDSVKISGSDGPRTP